MPPQQGRLPRLRGCIIGDRMENRLRPLIPRFGEMGRPAALYAARAIWSVLRQLRVNTKRHGMSSSQEVSFCPWIAW
jgi:hypothetical protein